MNCGMPARFRPRCRRSEGGSRGRFGSQPVECFRMKQKPTVTRERSPGLSYILALVIIGSCLAGCGPTIQTGLEDAQLTMRVKTALLNDSELGTQPIAVAVGGGVVELSGRVARVELITKAEQLVRRVAGVREVELTLDVGPPEFVGRDRLGRLPSLAPPETDEPLRLVAVGAGGTFGLPPNDSVGNGVGVGPVIRLRPRTGWGPSVGFSWTRTSLGETAGQQGLADLVVRPVMGGVEYGLSRGQWVAAFSLVGGYAFNSLDVDSSRVGPGRAIAVENGLALRAGLSVWYDISPRIGVNVFGGYRLARPQVTFASDADVTMRRLNADAILISLGMAYWLF